MGSDGFIAAVAWFENIEWPSPIRGAELRDRARKLYAAENDPDATVEENTGAEVLAVAYLAAAFVSELDFSDGESTTRSDAADAFIEELEAEAGIA